MDNVSVTGKSKKRIIGGSNRASLAFADELVVNEFEVDCMAAVDDGPLLESASAVSRRKSLSRRRSSMGFVGSSLGDEQNAHIAEMYKTVIQLSTEGKLNEKNSWKYDLIDHMGKLIRDENKGVNFQKASCTLDASVKIYSNRVDDTYTTSHRVLESLSRNNNSHAHLEELLGGEEDEAQSSKPKAKVGSKASCTRLNITQTIEKNVENINAVQLEHEYAFDPMFQKLSKAFDEGGAKGMLLFNMRMSTHSCSLSFLGKRVEHLWREAEKEAFSAARESDRRIDMADLVSRSGLTAEAVARSAICAPLAEYRRTVGVTPSEVGIVSDEEIRSAASRTLDVPFLSLSSSSPSHNRQSFSLIGHNTDEFQFAVSQGNEGEYHSEIHTEDDRESAHAAMAMAMDDDDGYDYDPSEDVDYFPSHDVAAAAPSSSSPSNSASTSASPFSSTITTPFFPAAEHGSPSKEKTKLAWSTPTEEEMMREATQQLESLKVSSGAQSDYAFFHVDDLVSEDNAWAGARHWSYRTRSKQMQQRGAATETAQGDSVNTAPTDESNATTAAGTKAKKKTVAAKKDANVFTLTLDLVDSALFGPSAASRAKSRTDVTRQTKAALEKNRQSARSLLLPADEKLKVQDLCRLFLLPKAVVPPKDMSILVRGSNGTRTKSGTSKARQLVDSLEGDDQLWSLDGHGITIKSTAPIETQTRTASTAAVTTTELQNGEPREEVLMTHFDDNDGYDDYGGNDFDDAPQFTRIAIDGAEDDHHTIAPAPPAPELKGLAINESNLIQASRVVEKIEINYAKVSKRVDVHKLKKDVWTNIQDHLGSAKPSRRLEAAPTPTAPDMSFQELVQDLSAEEGQQQKDVSLAYYFICLLHLANENTLKITGHEDMADLTIQYDKDT